MSWQFFLQNFIHLNAISVFFFPTLALIFHKNTKHVFKLTCCEYVHNTIRNPQRGLIQPEILYRNSHLGSNSSREKYGEIRDDSVSDRNITLIYFLNSHECIGHEWNSDFPLINHRGKSFRSLIERMLWSLANFSRRLQFSVHVSLPISRRNC